MTLTLPKILLLLVVCWLVWTFLRKNNIIGGSKAGHAPRTPPAKKDGTIEDMVKCPKCGAYIPAKGGGHDCPGA
jgi:hypothetical protein